MGDPIRSDPIRSEKDQSQDRWTCYTHSHTSQMLSGLGLYQYWPMIQLLTRSTVLRHIWIFPFPCPFSILSVLSSVENFVWIVFRLNAAYKYLWLETLNWVSWDRDWEESNRGTGGGGAARGWRWFWPMCDNYIDFCRCDRFEASSPLPQERISGRRESGSVCVGLPVRHFFFESLLAVRKQTVHCIPSHFCVLSLCVCCFSVASTNIGTVFSIINACGNYQAQFDPKRNDATFFFLLCFFAHCAGLTGDCNQHLHAKYLH